MKNKNAINNSNEQYNFVFDDNGWGQKAALEYQKRRLEYLQKGSSPLLLWGVQESPLASFHFSADFATLYQESHILYFTGIKQHQVALWLNPLAKKKQDREILFLPTKDSTFEFWQGKMLGISKEKGWSQFQKKLLGFQSMQHISEVAEILQREMKKIKLKEISFFFHESKNKRVKKDHQYFLNQKIKKQIANQKIQFSNQYQIITDLRNKINLQDKKNISKAIQITKNAFLELLQQKSKMSDEREVANFLKHKMTKDFPLHYSLIVGAGENAACLHYVKNNEKIKANSLVLIDFGVKHHHIGCDVTRVFPIGKKMNPLQVLLYEIVLDTNKMVIKNVKAGAIYKEIENLAWQFLETELQKRFISKGGKMKRNYQKAPHGLGHMLGYEVHDGDAFGEYKNRPLQEGWVVTNEPGLYGEFEITMNKKKYHETIGIRIEDNLLITKNGCQNLTKEIPKEIAELEKY